LTEFTKDLGHHSAENDIDESVVQKKTNRSMKWARVLRLVPVVVLLMVSAIVGMLIQPTWIVHQFDVTPEMLESPESAVSYQNSGLTPADLERYQQDASLPVQNEVLILEKNEDGSINYSRLIASKHFGFWSLLPAMVAIALCWYCREPLAALLMGIACGALVMQQYDLTENILLPSMATRQTAGIILLYLWLLGGLMGIWTRTGAAVAFAETVTRHFVRGPRSAKFVAWALGIVFFQGGTISTVIVGTTVKPISDQHRVSHEELSYVVDSTASPIACLIPFNAWPAYVQSLIFIPGVSYLMTESDRINFYFAALPLSFYAMAAILGTLLLSFDVAPFLGKRFRKAIKRSRTTGQLSRENRQLTFETKTVSSQIQNHYQSHTAEFVVPILALIAVAMGSFFWTGTPQVRWAFGLALLISAITAYIRGMTLQDIVKGIGEGLQGVVMFSLILVLAVTMGNITQTAGGGLYLVECLGGSIPYWLLPGTLFAITIMIAFSTGTSWGTYAIAFPLTMPLAMAIASTQQLADEKLYLMINFACVLNGSVFGDQCSPISDTTIISALTTGTDLMDHVLTQIVPASLAAGVAVLGWTLLALTCN